MNWRDLKIGMHVRLICGCEGFVSAIHLEGDNEAGEIGFHVKYTKDHSFGSRRWGYRNSYSDGYGPYGNFFNHGMQDEYNPVECPAPAWYPSLEAGPDRKIQKLKAERRMRQIAAYEKRDS